MKTDSSENITTISYWFIVTRGNESFALGVDIFRPMLSIYDQHMIHAPSFPQHMAGTPLSSNLCKRSFSQLSLISFPIKDLNALDCGVENPPDTISQSIKTYEKRKRLELRDQLGKNFTI